MILRDNSADNLVFWFNVYFVMAFRKKLLARANNHKLGFCDIKTKLIGF